VSNPEIIEKPTKEQKKNGVNEKLRNATGKRNTFTMVMPL